MIEYQALEFADDIQPELLAEKLTKLGKDGWHFAFKHSNAIMLHRDSLEDDEDPMVESEGEGEFNCGQCEHFTPQLDKPNDDGVLPGYCERNKYSTKSIGYCQEMLDERRASNE